MDYAALSTRVVTHPDVSVIEQDCRSWNLRTLYSHGRGECFLARLVVIDIQHPKEKIDHGNP